jgi:hypothetical protein
MLVVEEAAVEILQAVDLVETLLHRHKKVAVVMVVEQQELQDLQALEVEEVVQIMEMLHILEQMVVPVS